LKGVYETAKGEVNTKAVNLYAGQKKSLYHYIGISGSYKIYQYGGSEYLLPSSGIYWYENANEKMSNDHEMRREEALSNILYINKITKNIKNKYVYAPGHPFVFDFDKLNKKTAKKNMEYMLSEFEGFKKDFAKVYSIKDYEKRWRKGEGHWKDYGVYLGYLDIYEMMGLKGERLEISEIKKFPFKDYVMPVYPSSTLKNFKAENWEILKFKDYVYPKVKVFTFDGEKIPAINGNVFGDVSKYKNGFHTYKAHGYYYNGNISKIKKMAGASDLDNLNNYPYFGRPYSSTPGYAIFENENIKEGKNVLIVGDSYSQPLPWYISQHFKKTYYILYVGSMRAKDDKYWNDFFAKNDIDTVLVVTSKGVWHFE
jgi:hypothetical protein